MKNKEIMNMPMLPVRSIIICPHLTTHFDVGRKKSLAAIEEVMAGDKTLFLVAQRFLGKENPKLKDLYKSGTVCKIKQLLKLPGDTVRVLVEGLYSADLSDIVQIKPYYMAEMKPQLIDSNAEDSNEIQALMKTAKLIFLEHSKKVMEVPEESKIILEDMFQAEHALYLMTVNSGIGFPKMQEILALPTLEEKYRRLISEMSNQIDIEQIEKNIKMQVKFRIDKVQKDFYLKEQIKAMQNELEDGESLPSEIKEYKSKLTKAKAPKYVRDKVNNEIKKLERAGSSSGESGIIRSYIETVVNLPWSKSTTDKNSITDVKEILESEHYGLEDVKERILEYIAVRKFNNEIKGPILCLVGPPGVGKTSIAKSIAHAMNRKFVRMSLGGVRDEAEIRGHRRTYIGAIPGRIISGMNEAKVVNPVFLLDEIDKMGSDYKGDPAGAMLEVLDPEQNKTFRDHYLELDYDLSKVLFVTTANTLDTIPRPLLDRMEIIDVSGYTDFEKYHICKEYLIKSELKENGLTSDNVNISDQAIKHIINSYTRESGVRGLKRQIGSLYRKCVIEILEDKDKTIKITKQNLKKYLGPEKFKYQDKLKEDEIGVVMGLAWTAYGGDTLPIEATIMKGSGKLELTGKLGDVMKESAKIAYSYVRANSKKYGIDEDFYKKFDIHIHAPEGAIPKDGPSAGVTMITAMVSALSKNPVRHDIAMTGEVTLTGNVLPIGGVKEKSLSAYRAGIKTIILPEENRKDVDKIPEYIRKNMKFIFAEKVDTVIDSAIKGEINDN